MNISVVGLGYVGCVSVACLAESGHSVIGTDIKQIKVDLLNSGKPTIVEKGLSELIKKNTERISATLDVKQATLNSDVSVICVGTPSNEDGSLSTVAIERSIEAVAYALREKNSFHVISIRSTVPVGTNFSIGKLVEEISGKVRGQDFEVINNPEFLREGSAVSDYFSPPITIVGAPNKESKAVSTLWSMYEDIPGEKVVVETETAELIKFVNNSWHALKIVFTNEVSRVCKEYSANSLEVMDIFCRDTKLNLSSYYCRPGFAFGGPCLLKDLKGFLSLASDKNVSLPMLSKVEESNELHIDYALRLILEKNVNQVAFLGISFKPGTDDLRNSTKLQLAKKLVENGVEVKIHDAQVSDSLKNKINDIYIKKELGSLEYNIYEDLDEVLSQSKLVVISHNEPYYDSILTRLGDDQVLFRLFPSKTQSESKVVQENCW